MPHSRDNPSAMAAPDSRPRTTDLSPSVLSVAAATSCIFAATSIGFIDRPVAEFAHAVRGNNEASFALLTHIVDPVPVAAGLILAGAIGTVLAGFPLGPRWRVAIRVALAVVIAVALKDLMKGFAGRTWPETWVNNNPSYIKDGVYGFFLMQGKSGGAGAYTSFPSGHMTAISAAAVSLALAFPRWRWAAPVPIGLVAIGLLGANYHWVSDIVVGAALGAATALAVHRAARSCSPGPIESLKSAPHPTLVAGKSTIA